MFYSESNYAYVSDGNVRLLVFPPAVERGSLIGLLWSDSNEVKELMEKLSSAASDFQAMSQRLYEIDQSA